MEREKWKKSGVITVFFTFAGLLILALTGSMLYAALYAGARAVGERALRLSAESAAAGYLSPLFEDYHIFGKTASYGAESAGGNAGNTGGNGAAKGAEELLALELKEWLARSLEQGNDAAGTGFLMTQEILSAEVSQIEYLLSGGGERFFGQAVAYQKYRTVSDAVLGTGDLLAQMKGVPAASVVLKKKEAAEQEYALAVMETAELMALIDGVKWEQKYFIITKKGIFAADRFVKKMWSGEISAQSTGLNHPEVFDKMKGHYVRFDRMAEEAVEAINGAQELEAGIAGLEAEIEEVRKEIEALTAPEAEGEAKDALLKQKNELEGELMATAAQRSRRLKHSEDLIEEMIAAAKNSYEASTEAMELIEKTKSRIEGAEKALDAYEAVLEAGQSLIDPGLYSQLKEEAVALRKTSGMEFDLESCGTALERWREAALKIRMKLLELRKPELTRDDRLEKLNHLTGLLGELTWSGPAFDYSRLKTAKADQTIPEIFENLISLGIASLVLPEKPEISTKVLSMEGLPSGWRGITGEENVRLKQDALFGLPLSGLAQTAAEKILYMEYIQDHFKNYLTGTADTNAEINKKDTALDYELEYLLCGNKKDGENLNGAISRIILVRTLIRFISLLTDSGARSEVRGAAEAAVLFTGIPVLKYILMTALLFVWAAALSLIEVCAMLSGKKLPVWPDRKDRVLAFSELLMLSPALIRQKAELLKEENGSGAGYQDYLKLLLAAADQEKLIFRTMDLIEANIRLRYDDGFRFLNCICGFRAQAKFRVPLRFPVFPAVGDMISGGGLTYQVSVQTGY